MLALILLEVDALNLHDLLEPGPESGACKPDLLPGQPIEDGSYLVFNSARVLHADLLVSLSTAPDN